MGNQIKNHKQKQILTNEKLCNNNYCRRFDLRRS